MVPLVCVRTLDMYEDSERLEEGGPTDEQQILDDECHGFKNTIGIFQDVRKTWTGKSSRQRQEE